MADWIEQPPYAFLYTIKPKKDWSGRSEASKTGLYVLDPGAADGPDCDRAGRERAIFSIANILGWFKVKDLYEFMRTSGRFCGAELERYTPGSSFTVSAAGQTEDPDPQREYYREAFWYFIQCNEAQLVDVHSAIAPLYVSGLPKIQTVSRAGARMDRNHDKSKHVCGGAGKSRKRSANVGVGTDSREGKRARRETPEVAFACDLSTFPDARAKSESEESGRDLQEGTVGPKD